MRYMWLLVVLLITVIALVVLALLKYHSKKSKANHKRTVLLAHTRKIKKLPAYEAVRRRYKRLLVLTGLTFILAIFATGILAARPVKIKSVDQDYESRDIMLCIDVSGSMTSYLSDLVGYYEEIATSLKGQRIGLTIFAVSSAQLVPLTNDYDALIEILSEFRDNFSSNSRTYHDVVGSGSQIGEGALNCIDNLGNLSNEKHSQAVVIATDNEQYGGNIDITQAANYAKSHNVTMYGVDIYESSDIGSRSGAFRRAMALTGGNYYYLYQRGISARDAAQQIMRLEQAKHDGASQYILYDSPEIAAIVTLILVAILGVLIWRLQL